MSDTRGWLFIERMK